MNEHKILESKNPFIRDSYKALQEAGKLAREEAIRTNTGIVVLQDGEVVTITAEELKKEAIAANQ